MKVVREFESHSLRFVCKKSCQPEADPPLAEKLLTMKVVREFESHSPFANKNNPNRDYFLISRQRQPPHLACSCRLQGFGTLIQGSAGSHHIVY